LCNLLASLRNGVSTKPIGDSGVPVLRISALRPNQVNVDDIRHLPGRFSDYEGFEVHEGDLLFTRYSGNTHFVGICGVVPPLPQKLVHPDKLIRGILVPGMLVADYIALAINCGESRRYIDRCLKTTAGQVGISGRQLKRTPVPIPPLAEQKRIVAKVEQLMKLCDALEAALRRSEDRAAKLAEAMVQEMVA
jgi:type I restriction enzyme S subunit